MFLVEHPLKQFIHRLISNLLHFSIQDIFFLVRITPVYQDYGTHTSFFKKIVFLKNLISSMQNRRQGIESGRGNRVSRSET